MFFLSYLRSELVRRKSRTILTVLGLAVGVALVIAVSSLSRGLDEAQAKALNPLSSIGTDLTVTLAPQTQDASQGGGPGGGGFGGRPRGDRGEPVGDHRPLEARQARRQVRPRLLPARHAADVPADDRRPDRQGRRRRIGLERPRARRRAPVRDGAEDRREDQGGRPADPGQPADPAADRGRVRRDADVPAEGGHHRRRAPGRRRAARRPRAASGGGLGGGGARRWRRPERVRQVPAGPAAALPRHDHDARADVAAGGQSAADEHQELHLHDRRRRSDDAGHRRRHRSARLERPLHRREQGRAAPTRRCSRAPTRAART